MTDDTQKIGIGLTSFGVLFMALGVLFFFDRALLSFGNVLFIAGVSLTIGRKRALKFFVNRRGNHRGSVCFLGGLALVLFGWPFFGICLEAYGGVLLFSGFLPVVLLFLRRLPVIGSLFNLPLVNKFFAGVGSARGVLPV